VPVAAVGRRSRSSRLPAVRRTQAASTSAKGGSSDQLIKLARSSVRGSRHELPRWRDIHRRGVVLESVADVIEGSSAPGLVSVISVEPYSPRECPNSRALASLIGVCVDHAKAWGVASLQCLTVRRPVGKVRRPGGDGTGGVRWGTAIGGPAVGLV
jgi:hypothetical protein